MQAPRTHAIASRTYICVARRVEYEHGLVEDARPSPRPLLLAFEAGHLAANPTIRTRQLVLDRAVTAVGHHRVRLRLRVMFMLVYQRAEQLRFVRVARGGGHRSHHAV